MVIDVSREGWVKTDALQCKDSSPEILPRFLPRSFFSKFNVTPISSARGRGERKEERGKWNKGPLRPSRRFFLAIRGARRGAVTFNSRARRRPICVVRAPITPDKVEAIYLPSVGDAITRLRPSSTEGEKRTKRGTVTGTRVAEVRREWVEVIYATGEGEHTFGRK